MDAILADADVEKVQLTEETVNPGIKATPKDFELLKLLGKGGYGKVYQVRVAINNSLLSYSLLCSDSNALGEETIW